MPTSNFNVTQTTQIDSGVDVYFDRLFLERALPALPHMMFGQKRPIPAGSGDTIKFRRYASLSVATTPLGEVEDPNPDQLSKTDILAQVSLYGKVVKISSTVDLTVPDNVGAETTELLGENYAETLDELTRDVLAATSSTTTCSNGLSVATELNKTDIDTVVQTLLGTRARFTADMVSSNPNQGTTPIRNAFMGIADTDLLDDLEAVTGFKSVALYGNQAATFDGEWGSTGNVRWILTDKGYVSGSNYTNPIIGRNAYGLVDITGGTSKLIFHPASTAGSDLELWSAYGWKDYFVARILNDNFLHGLICTNG
jgi:N4-gp56 family major capsid protein